MVKDLQIDQELKPVLKEIKTNWDSIKSFNSILQDQDSGRHARGELIFNKDTVEEQLQKLLNWIAPILAKRNDMHLPINSLSGLTKPELQYVSLEQRSNSPGSPHTRGGKRNISTTEHVRKLKIRQHTKGYTALSNNSALKVRSNSYAAANADLKQVNSVNQH